MSSMLWREDAFPVIKALFSRRDNAMSPLLKCLGLSMTIPVDLVMMIDGESCLLIAVQ
jgi:hypothetical protein